MRVLRITPHLVEVAFVDTTSTPLQHEHHLIMRAGKRGLYGYDILTAVAATSINEIRMNARWDRSIFDHSFNWERGKGQQPTYAYLATQQSVQDETWLVDGVNNPNLPSPGSNSGNLPAGTVYTKYNWSLYHHENPMFGHYGNGFGAWLTPLGGVTADTLCAFYGVGPQHQDLAIHQDALILNYFGANHYGLPGYALPAGYRRLYGPWFTYITAGDPADPDAMIEDAADIARAEIAENRAGADWITDDLYPRPADRTLVTGRLKLTDGRPAGGHWIVLSTQNVTDVYTIHEPTYFVKTDADGNFRLPGIPPPGSRVPTRPAPTRSMPSPAGDRVPISTCSRASSCAARTRTSARSGGRPPSTARSCGRSGGPTARRASSPSATKSPAVPMPRAYEKPAQIPGTLTFTVGTDWEPEGWYYAQTNPGVWTVSFTLARAYTGTAYLTVSTAMQQGGRPTVAVNGDSADITGSLPANNDSTIARQADRSGFPRVATLSFPASLLVVGANTVTFTHGSASAAGTGPGWDTIVLEVDEGAVAPRAQLAAHTALAAHDGQNATWRLTITNTGAGEARDVRLDAVVWRQPRRGRRRHWASRRRSRPEPVPGAGGGLHRGGRVGHGRDHGRRRPGRRRV